MENANTESAGGCRHNCILRTVFQVLMLLVCFCPIGDGYAGVLVQAGALHVDLRASDDSAGANVWSNKATLGHFVAVGAPFKVNNVEGTGIAGVYFDGLVDAYYGPVTVPDLEGSSARSIEVWAYNPVVSNLETLVSWGDEAADSKISPRSIVEFRYGNHSISGAVDHSSESIAYAAVPSAGAWHHLAYTYDGNTSVSVYVDGLLDTNCYLSAPLATGDGGIITVGAARERNRPGSARLQAGAFSGYIATLRIHGDVLSGGDILNNRNAGPEAQTPARWAQMSVPDGTEHID